MKTVLYYVHDPMCSWCWGISETLSELIKHLPAEIEFKRLLGGLAPDSDEPMPDYLVDTVKKSWLRIEETIPGKKFNFDFWTKTDPRRSTYPACRAVIAARKQGSQYDEEMTRAIQKAYYQQARNPSDNEILIELASELGLSVEKFKHDLISEETEKEFQKELNLAQELFVESYPSFILEHNGEHFSILIDYNSYKNMLDEIKSKTEN